VFPEKIGDFALVGIPTDLNGTVDVDGYYAREAKGVRTVIAVSIYPPDSAQPETTPASFKASAASIEISKKPPVRASKLAFKEGKSSRAIVYFVDAGPWIIRIRSSVPATDKEFAPAIEKFVRGQRWDSLRTS
jgi:hypothetical protein